MQITHLCKLTRDKNTRHFKQKRGKITKREGCATILRTRKRNDEQFFLTKFSLITETIVEHEGSSKQKLPPWFTIIASFQLFHGQPSFHTIEPLLFPFNGLKFARHSDEQHRNRERGNARFADTRELESRYIVIVIAGLLRASDACIFYSRKRARGCTREKVRTRGR